MELNVRLFATLKDRAGQANIQVQIAGAPTVANLLAAIEAAYPALAPSLPTALIAVNQEFAFADTTLTAADEVAIFPPVSGGAAGDLPWPTYFALSVDRPDLNAIHDALTRPDVGAIVTFTGKVRGQTNREGLPAATIHLEYEAYEQMARDKMAQVAVEIWDRWPQVKGVAIVQRIGKLEVGETTTIVACAAGHRDQGAFAAARYGIDRLKEIVPVWKKEVGTDKSVWIEGQYQPTAADRAGE